MMSTEIEIKYRLDDAVAMAAFAARLEGLGARPLGWVLEENILLDAPDARLRIADAALRLRLSTPLDAAGEIRPLVTFKGPRRPGRVKIRPEVEFHADDPAACEELFNGLGFRRTLTFEKRRRSFDFEGCRVELDELPALGCFLEIEGPDEQTIAAAAARLGADKLTQEHNSYARLVDICLEGAAEALRF